ncbi:hypothetical protein HRR83_004756 [Exophiala dermatitidis]|uniref:Uncharacterized protein n=1 Tax=Exophiala dermatitidis TaxID=5970 RepID=A0AAN6EZM8_EXODE|nr:hypothetical protein HRR75_003632 [Exophiala dermatitidis]KAJ4519222.1 hypothetical protein HRR74_003963 [Exophiala dermatitidis]KAJ4538434.1 hypothetical protein HRR77_006919 [Exophiala dermatitidis]KAJ4544318.1 hypothetical protein HRR76_002383 [Exophiala dermatitidis]KAJ4557923.1 hypothetical protein HRR78_001598 [Exophiala dermatitidis]
MAPTSPQERFDQAKKHAALLRALLSHPAMVYKPDGSPDRTKIHPTLFNVTDFEMSTYTKYILPLLPENAHENCHALSFQPGGPKGPENMDKLADDLYPRMSGGGMRQKWIDATSRGFMISSIILDKNKQMLFGGSFDFGDEVEAAARALT